MPTPSEIKTALQIAGENKEIIAISVYNQLQGIAKQGIWKKRDETLISTADLDLDTIDQAILDIITGDYALFCLEQDDDGVDLAKANLFDTYVLHVLAIIKSKLETLRPTNPQKCAPLIRAIKENLESYWIEL